MFNAKASTAMLAVGAFLMAGMLPGHSAALLPNGPEPYSAADPQYPPMKSEPVLTKEAASAPPQLSDGKATDGPAAGPQPYTAADPLYAPAAK